MTGMTTHAVVPTLVLPTIRNQSSGPVLAVELPSSSESRARSEAPRGIHPATVGGRLSIGAWVTDHGVGVTPTRAGAGA